MAGKGGAREGAGRPKQEIVRTSRSTKAYDYEWELIKRFMRVMKNENFEECQAFVQELEERS